MISNILLLILSSAIWGFGFVATRWTFVSFDPYWSTALRFILVGFLSLPFLCYKKSFWRKDNILKKSLISSFFLMGMLLFQTIGLTITTVAKSGFITTLYSLFVPLICMLFVGSRYRSTFWVLILLALFGMALMCNLEIKDLNRGDFLTLLCSISAALHILYVGKIANSIASPVEFNFLQSLFVGVFCTILAFALKGGIHYSSIHDIGYLAIWGMLFLSIISSMFAYTIQIIAQKKIPAHIAGLIFLMESPFAALFGFIVFREKLNTLNLLGAICILSSVILVPYFGREVTATQKKGQR